MESLLVMVRFMSRSALAQVRIPSRFSIIQRHHWKVMCLLGDLLKNYNLALPRGLECDGDRRQVLLYEPMFLRLVYLVWTWPYRILERSYDIQVHGEMGVGEAVACDVVPPRGMVEGGECRRLLNGENRPTLSVSYLPFPCRLLNRDAHLLYEW